MTPYPILFNQTPDQLRRIGARGGRAQGRNWRTRKRTLTTARLTSVLSLRPTVETTAQAIVSLDDQFPWLYQAERRGPRR
jgi:hypothetical protein